MFFSKEEINKLKAFFEQLHIDTREYDDDQFKCSDEKDNAVFARLMDAGKILKAKITNIKTKDEYFQFISISICLVDL